MKKIYENVNLGRNIEIGDFVIIGKPPLGKRDGELETIIGKHSIIRDSTIIYSGNRIGYNFITGHHVVIRENNMIGNDVSIGTFGEIAFNVEIGDNVKLHSDCHVYEGTIIEDDVRINPGVYILNTKHPYRPGEKPVIDPVIIRKRAIISARSTLMPGIEIGKYSLIGAGSLVTKNVPEYAIVYGSPATIKGDIRALKNPDGSQAYLID